MTFTGVFAALAVVILTVGFFRGENTRTQVGKLNRSIGQRCVAGADAPRGSAERIDSDNACRKLLARLLAVVKKKQRESLRRIVQTVNVQGVREVVGGGGNNNPSGQPGGSGPPPGGGGSPPGGGSQPPNSGGGQAGPVQQVVDMVNDTVDGLQQVVNCALGSNC